MGGSPAGWEGFIVSPKSVLDPTTQMVLTRKMLDELGRVISCHWMAHFELTRTEYWDRAGGERNITFKAFCDFRRAKIAYNGLKMGSFHLFVHPKRSSHHFGKKGF